MVAPFYAEELLSGELRKTTTNYEVRNRLANPELLCY